MAQSLLGQRKADRAARRSAGAADRSAGAAERMATALELRALEDERRAPTPNVVWRLEHFQNDAYLLTNAGRAPAYEVTVSAGDMITDDLPDGITMRADDAVKFIAARTMVTRDDTITVDWSPRPGAQRESWSRPLPPKP